MFLVLIFTRGWVDRRVIVGSEGNMSLKNPVTRPGIDPGTVRLVAQHLNRPRPPTWSIEIRKYLHYYWVQLKQHTFETTVTQIRLLYVASFLPSYLSFFFFLSFTNLVLSFVGQLPPTPSVCATYITWWTKDVNEFLISVTLGVKGTSYYYTRLLAQRKLYAHVSLRVLIKIIDFMPVAGLDRIY